MTHTYTKMLNHLKTHISYPNKLYRRLTKPKKNQISALLHRTRHQKILV